MYLSLRIAVGHFDHLLHLTRKNPAPLGRGDLPRGSTQVYGRFSRSYIAPEGLLIPALGLDLAIQPERDWVETLPHTLEAITGLSVVPYSRAFRVPQSGDLRDPLPGGFLSRPAKGASSQWLLLSRTWLADTRPDPRFAISCELL